MTSRKKKVLPREKNIFSCDDDDGKRTMTLMVICEGENGAAKQLLKCKMKLLISKNSNMLFCGKCLVTIRLATRGIQVAEWGGGGRGRERDKR